MPEFAADKHTSAGKKRGLGVKEFFLEGSYVKNEIFP